MPFTFILNRWVDTLARALAWAGGGVLLAITAMSVASIAGRALAGVAGLGPVPGDFELVEAGAALVVFCFLPWCHWRRGHAVVDVLWRAWPPAVQRGLHALAQALMLAVWVLLTWRMGVAMLDYRANGETTFILHWPVWWGYAACLPPAVAGCLVYAWTLAQALGWAPPHEPARSATTETPAALAPARPGGPRS